MGAYQLTYTVIAAFVMTSLFAVSVILLISDITKTEAELRTSEEELTKVDAAHLVEKCFKDGEELILAESLNEKEIKGDICKACSLCIKDVGAKVIDLQLEGGDEKWEWDFSYDEDSKNKHDISINIDYGDYIHIGRLYVEV